MTNRRTPPTPIRRWLPAAAALLLLAAAGPLSCGHAGMHAAPQDPAPSTELDQLRRQESASLTDELRRAEAELFEVSPHAADPTDPTGTTDCARVCTLLERIDGLAARICRLADEDAQLVPQCADARTRRDRAAEAVSSRCTCPPAQPE